MEKSITVQAKDPRRLKRFLLRSRRRQRENGSKTSGARTARESAHRPAASSHVHQLARDQFARAFADVLAGRYGGRWSVDWEGSDDAALATDRDRGALASEK